MARRLKASAQPRGGSPAPRQAATRSGLTLLAVCGGAESCRKFLGALPSWRRHRFGAVAARVTAGQAFRKFLPLFDRVLVERSAAETVTKGGILLPEKSQGKGLHARVVAVGSGAAKGKGGDSQPVSVKVGDKVLLPEYGGTKVVLDDKDYFLFRDRDILGKCVN
ncbi:10 kDa heat shock protein, mitochondrial-like [Peromyscus eremicus]|uniref:10 kDa heat shock protein, mitochondrial-like n=1 Tax=Peromyscus eremicus TaxID=42410 RepID=UPI0027DCB633|nr:10 kDa heat shock protein, mitochondrial-like [Peromyscus eremicus]